MEEQLKQTCLHDLHVRAGARMSPFAGYDMPIQYSGIIDEHNAVRNHAGVFDVSHMGEIFISGADAEKFVNHIFTNDVRDLAPARYSTACCSMKTAVPWTTFSSTGRRSRSTTCW